MRAWLILTSAAIYWLAFMCVHESGHVLGAIVTGGNITRVVLNPLALSRTDVSPNPRPLLVCWAGPLWGAAAPLVVWAVWQLARPPASKWLRGLVGFCLIANGAYLASGALLTVGDTEELLRLGAPLWTLVLVGAPMTVAGLGMWHRLGPVLGTAGLSEDGVGRSAVVATIALVAIAGAMTLWTVLTR